MVTMSELEPIKGTPPAPLLYPSPSPAALKLQHVGKELSEVQAPAAILDLAVIKRNCRLMLEATQHLGVSFRAHVKTHKTTELTELQVGEAPNPVKLIGSTVAELENLLPWLLDCGRDVDVIYGLPISPSSIPRLAAIARALGGKGTVGVFADHPEHIKLLDASEWPTGTIPVWVNIDVGYHREGVPATSKQLADIAYALKASVRCHLAGVYTHMGHSYSVNSPAEALEAMSAELQGLQKGVVEFLKITGVHETSAASKVTLSLGATPTTASIQNLLDDSPEAQKYRAMIDKINQSFAVEFHAGVYPVNDMQQLATRARHAQSYADIGVRTLVEVASLYLDPRDPGGKPEALIAAGSIVMGREPCKSYHGWGVVTPWPGMGEHYDPEGERTGWIIGRISQEHGVLTWEGPRERMRELRIGEKLLMWPNHACIAGASFGWYLVVDGESAEPDKVVDVWVRWRGW